MTGLVNSLSSKSLRARFSERPVAFRGVTALSCSDLQTLVSALSASLVGRREQSWVLCCEDAFYFVCAFLAVLSAGKRVIIPPNFQPGTLASLVSEADGWIIDRPEHEADKPGPCVAVSSVNGPCSDFELSQNAVIDLYTSGTTGTPKRIRKKLAQLATEAEALESLWGAELGAVPVVGTVPHHHIYGLLFRLLWPLHAGRPFDVVPSGAPDELIKRLRFFERAMVISSPAQLSRWPDLIDLANLAPRVTRIFSSGGPLSTTAAKCYLRALGQAPTEVYGSSETGGIGWRMQNDAPECDTWTPSPGVEVRIAADTALEVRSPFIGLEGWFTMSDAAQLWPNGRFRLLGRLDRVVKIEEKRLSLSEMEERLKRYPVVADAAVVALEGERRVIGAVLVLSADGQRRLRDEGKRRISGELKEYLAQYYEPALLPRRWRFPSAMPHNERGKLSSAALAALFSD